MTGGCDEGGDGAAGVLGRRGCGRGGCVGRGGQVAGGMIWAWCSRFLVGLVIVMRVQ